MDESDCKKGKKRLPFALKFILIVSNIFSGFLTLIILGIGLFGSLLVGYITLFNVLINALFAAIVFISSIGVWLRNRKFSIPFVLGWIGYYFSYLYNRYYDMIYSSISKTELLMKITISTIWVVFIVFYFYFKIIRQEDGVE